MIELLPRQLGQRLLEKTVVGVGKEHFDRGARGLFFAMCVVEQHLVEVGAGAR